jgi:hypothetical protein
MFREKTLFFNQKGDSKMKILKILAAVVIAVCLLHMTPAQSSPTSKTNEAVKITEARKANAVLMRQYTWHSRTELIEKGEKKDIRIELVDYSPDGQIRHTLLNDQRAPLPRGFLRRSVAEKERKKMGEYLAGLRWTLNRYTLSTAGKVLDFMNQAATTGPDSAGQIQMTGRGVILPGDTLSIWSKAATRQTSKIAVTTFYQGDVVELTSTFKTLPSGLTHLEYAEVVIPAKQLTMQVHNFNYTDNAPAAAVQKVKEKPLTGTPSTAAVKKGMSLQVVEKKLKDLKSLMDQGLISQSDYDAKKAQILKGL